MLQKLFRHSASLLANRNLQQATVDRSPACRIRDTLSENLRVCTRQLVLRSATRVRTDARQTKLFANARSREIPVACAPTSLLRASAGVRARTPVRETPLPAPVHSPGPAAAPHIPTVLQTKSHWCPHLRPKSGPLRSAASLLRSAGLRVSLFPCARPSRSFPQAPGRDRQRQRCQSGKRAHRETWESNALRPAPLPIRSKAAP